MQPGKPGPGGRAPHPRPVSLNEQLLRAAPASAVIPPFTFKSKLQPVSLLNFIEHAKKLTACAFSLCFSCLLPCNFGDFMSQILGIASEGNS